MTQPHYIDREAVARIIDPAAFMFSPGELADKVYSASRAHAFDRADRILALIAAPMEAVAWREKVLKALHFYADAHQFPNDGPWGIGSNDFGEVARQALAVIPTQGGEGHAKPNGVFITNELADQIAVILEMRGYPELVWELYI